MLRNLLILGLVTLVVVVPLVFQAASVTGGRTGPPGRAQRIVSPHNETIEYEFEQAFTHWHHKHHGAWVKIDWRNLGGTSEISRYLTSEYVAVFLGAGGKAGASPGRQGRKTVCSKINRRPRPDWRRCGWRFARRMIPGILAVRLIFFSAAVNLTTSRRTAGTDVAAVAGRPGAGGEWRRGREVLIPESLSGETWRRDYLFGAVLSTSGSATTWTGCGSLGSPAATTLGRPGGSGLFRAARLG